MQKYGHAGLAGMQNVMSDTSDWVETAVIDANDWTSESFQQLSKYMSNVFISNSNNKSSPSMYNLPFLRTLINFR